ncbi:iron ABC transporter permease [Desulfovibrio sp. JY]|nr:iron ABC transporter permease [Desulfovibrio sp. JY]
MSHTPVASPRAAARARYAIPVLAAVLVLAAVWSLTVGQYPITLGDQWRFCLRALSGQPSAAGEQHRIATVLCDIRFPRLLAAMLVGAVLAASGTAYQAMFVNPLVSPGLLGVLAGSAFGAAVGMLAGVNWTLVQVFAFTGGITAVGLAVAMAGSGKGDKLLLLILGGVISSALFTALLAAAKYVADPNDELPAITYWLMGGLSRADGTTMRLAGPAFCLGLVLLFRFAGRLDLLSLGDEEARSLGLSTGPVRLALIALSTVLCALTVSIAGLIGWVGLIIPHAGRMLVGPGHGRLLPVAALLGAVYLLAVDDISRLAFGVEIPLGILTALIGIPFFPLVLKNARKGWS